MHEESVDKSLWLILDFFWQILHFHFHFLFLFLQERAVYYLSFWKVLDEIITINLFHSCFRLIHISCMFLNSACFKVCLENHSHIFINEHLRGNLLALNWIAISFLVSVFWFANIASFSFSNFHYFTFGYGIMFSERRKFSEGWSLYK